MATITIPNLFVSGTLAKSSEVNANFALLQQFIQSELIQKDASLAFTAVPSGPTVNPTADNHLVRKRYVDSGLQGWTPTWTGLTLGTGPTNVGRWFQNGRQVTAMGHVILGTGGVATSTIFMDWAGKLPAAHSDFATHNIAAAYAWSDTSAQRHGGVGIFADGNNNRVGRFASDGASIGWGVGEPGTWGVSSQLNVWVTYLTT